MYTSVIIPTYKRSKDLEITLDSLCKQIILPNETIIVDQSGDNETRKLCEIEKYKSIGMRYFHRDDTSSARARNQGIEELNKKSELVLFFDDDVEIDSKYIEEVIYFLNKNPNALGGGGYQSNIPKKSLWTKIGLFLFNFSSVQGDFTPFHAWRYNSNKIQNVTIVSGYSLFLRKNILDKGYRFPQWMDRYSREDNFLTKKISTDFPNSLFYLPQLKIAHYESNLARVNLHQRLKQEISHMFLYHHYFSLPGRKYYWRSLSSFFHRFSLSKSFGNKINIIYNFFNTHIFLIKNKNKYRKDPSIINNFIFGK